MSADSPDVIVVGSGAGGAFTAYGLAQAGIRVLLIERGPRFNPSKDYYLNYPDWEFRDPFIRHIPDTYSSSGIMPIKEFSHIKTTMIQRDLTEREFRYQCACGVGGSTLKYQAEAHRFPPHAFKMKSLYDIGDDWPITYNDLAPYYERVEALLEVAGINHPAFPKETPYPNPTHPLSCASQKVAAGCNKLGLNLVPNSLAILSRPSKGRPSCIYCKLCSLGCMLGDKSSVDITVIPYAEKTGNLKVMAETAVLKVIVNQKGMAEGVLVFDRKNKSETVLRAKVIVLACGAIETPRLLLNSSNNPFPDGLLNGNGLVGAYLMENIYAAVLFVFREKVQSYKGVPIDSRVWDFLSPQPKKGYNRGFALGSYGAPDGIIGPASFAMWVAREYGKKHREFVEKYYGAHSMVFGVADHLPSKTNSVSLDREEKDEFGLLKAKVSVNLGHEDLRIIEKMLDLCKDVALASGAEKIIGQYTAYDYSNATHVCGTARMGNSIKDSVVNQFCQSHAIKNLFITDASVFVTQGCGVSPSLTIQAIALRASDYIAAELKKGNL